MKSKADKFLVLSFCTTLALALLLLLFLTPQRFSEMENRLLQPFPNLTLDKLISKEYGNELENYFSDHFPFRNQWVMAKSHIERLRLQNENNGIYYGKEGYLFEKFLMPEEQKLLQYTDSLNEFSSKHHNVNITLMLIPTSVGVYPDKLPWLAPSYPQDQVNQKIGEYVKNTLTFIDGYDFLSADAAEPVYYRTDHHWNTNGAYLGYLVYAKEMGWKPLSKNEFKIQTISESFLGSYHTRSQFSRITPDTIQAYFPRKPIQTKIYIADTEETVNSLYNESFLTKKDKYSYFLGGVHALMKITSQLKPEQIQQEKLLVIKDSYAHNLIPFLTNHVAEIYIIDIRYYNGNISEFMQENGIEEVLFIFNTSTFVNNSELLKLRK
ncbi:DHHW family protein [Bacillus sp. JJ1474]|uniref:DHHW family protein n=1 Tax=Bacillus sp. JJ1474 TaxID=3122955 RepID=UPI003000B33E